MGSMFGSKPKVTPFTPSAEQKELEKRQKEDRLKADSEIEQTKALKKRKAAGRTSLLSGSESGLKTKLG